MSLFQTNCLSNIYVLQCEPLLKFCHGSQRPGNKKPLRNCACPKQGEFANFRFFVSRELLELSKFQTAVRIVIYKYFKQVNDALLDQCSPIECREWFLMHRF